MSPPPEDDPEFINLLLEQNKDFRQLMEESARQARNGEVSSLDEVRARLGQSSS